MKTIHNLFNNLIAFLLGLTSGCTVIFGTILVGVIIAIGEILEKEEKEPKRVSYYNRPKRRQFYSSMMQDQNDEDIEEENENENNN